MPWSSLTAVRAPSISAGLLASTVTPGSTAPDASRTTPVIALPVCAAPSAGRSRTQHETRIARRRDLVFMDPPFLGYQFFDVSKRNCTRATLPAAVYG